MMLTCTVACFMISVWIADWWYWHFQNDPVLGAILFAALIATILTVSFVVSLKMKLLERFRASQAASARTLKALEEAEERAEYERLSKKFGSQA